MRNVAVVVTALAVLSGCAMQPQPGRIGGGGGGSSLRATILPPRTHAVMTSARANSATRPLEVSFRVNRPAYVAVFEIVPGYGTRVVYPSVGYGTLDGRVHGGLTSSVRLDQRLLGDYRFAAAGGGRQSQPRVYFMIASERPLAVSRGDVMGYGGGLERSLGFRRVSSIDPYRTMESLLNYALPADAPAGSWSTDMYVYWPEVVYPNARGAAVRLSCGGVTYYVAIENLGIARQMLCQAKPEAEQGRPKDRDTTIAGTEGGRRLGDGLDRESLMKRNKRATAPMRRVTPRRTDPSAVGEPRSLWPGGESVRTGKALPRATGGARGTATTRGALPTSRKATSAKPAPRPATPPDPPAKGGKGKGGGG